MPISAGSHGSHRALSPEEACRILRPRCMRSLVPWVGLAAAHYVVRFLVSQAKIHRRPGCCRGLQVTTLMGLNNCQVCWKRASLYVAASLCGNRGDKCKEGRSRTLIGRRRICPLRYGRVTSSVALLTNVSTAYHEQTLLGASGIPERTVHNTFGSMSTNLASVTPWCSGVGRQNR